jgi:hypothetical protein
LNIVKGKRNRTSPSGDADSAEDLATSGFDDESSGSSPLSNMNLPNGMSPEEMQKAFQNVDPEQMKAAMKKMDELLDSNYVTEYFGDDEKNGKFKTTDVTKYR